MAHAGGRPTDYRDEYCEQAAKLCLLGATDKELADFFDVSESTLNLWKTTHSEFSESLKSGKTLADANIAKRLYQRAMGYEHPETKFFTVNKGDFQQEIETRETIKIYPPDTTAAIFWLKNRQPAKWRDKQEIEHSSVDVIMPEVPESPQAPEISE